MPMAGQHPLTLIFCEGFHGFNLDIPVIPTEAIKTYQLIEPTGPGEVITCKEVFILIEQNRVALGMARDRDNLEVGDIEESPLIGTELKGSYVILEKMVESKPCCFGHTVRN